MPICVNGQLALPSIPSPAPVVRSTLRAAWWLYWRITKDVDDAQRRELGLPRTAAPAARRMAERGSLEIQAYDEACFPGLAAEWNGRRPFVGALTMELPTDADSEVASWIAAGTPPIYFGFGSTPVQSPADTIAMIAAACAELDERALIYSGASGSNCIPHSDRVKLVGPVNYSAILPIMSRGRPSRWRGHHSCGPAGRNPHVGPLGRSRSAVMGGTGHTNEGRLRPTLVDNHPRIAGRAPPPNPRAAVRHPSLRNCHPDDQAYRKRLRGGRSPGGRGPQEVC